MYEGANDGLQVVIFAETEGKNEEIVAIWPWQFGGFEG
jgi:hypothetical protein